MSDSKALSLSQSVEEALAQYFANLNGEVPTSLHKMVLAEVERPLIESVMKHVGGNQTQAAEMLGINRNTLRSRLELFELLD